MLGIEHPIVMGGLTGVGVIELAAAVSGLLAALGCSPPQCWVSEAPAKIRRLKTLTSKPFGVNLTVLPTIGPPPPYEYAQCSHERI